MNNCNFNLAPLFFGDSEWTNQRREGNTDADAILAKELHELSIDERERVFNEIHGVNDPSAESDPADIDGVLAELDDELKKIKKKSAYERAVFLSPRYVRDKDFRLMFLRADLFDTTKAAKRMVNYYKYKLELFGEDKLVKKLSLEDLDQDDIDELITGSFQVLLDKDRSGRPVVVVMQSRFQYKTWQSKLRTVWYMMISALYKDPANNAIVNVYYNLDIGMPERLYLDLVSKIRIINDSLPYRNVSCHYCYNNPALRPAMNLLQLVAGRDNRLRFRTHMGSHMECQYMLMTFGIPKEALPADNVGNYRPEVIERYIAARQAIEAERAAEEPKDLIACPSKRDVLLGRGKPYQAYSGNLMLARLVESRRAEYNKVSRFEKTCMSMDMVNVVKEYKGRFLRRDETTGGWAEVDDAAAREKVSSSFRTRPRKDIEESVAVAGVNGLEPYQQTAKRAKFFSPFF